MITDQIPDDSQEKDEYLRSDVMRTMPLPAPEPARLLSAQLEVAMKAENRREIERLCNAIASYVSESFAIAAPKVKILGARPLKVKRYEADELYADYDFETAKIRLWMRTAVLEKMTSFGTLLSTLCHEICHHIDVVYFKFGNTFHTRGFYERAGILYHHVRGTPIRPLVWDRMRDGTYRINWKLTMQRRS